MSRIVLHDALSIIRAKLEVETSKFSIRMFLADCDASRDIDLWIWDGAGAKKMRQAIYPGYKSGRVPMSESIYAGMKFVKQAMLTTKVVNVEVPAFEADDVIAALAQKFGRENYEVHINTRDLDLRALVTCGPRVTCSVKPKEDVPDEHLRLYKAFVGDPSDSVKGVKGFGHEGWKKLPAKGVLKNIIDHINRGIPLKRVELEEFMSKSAAQWIIDNKQELLAMWVTVGFLPVPHEAIDRFTSVGQSNPNERNKQLSEFAL